MFNFFRKPFFSELEQKELIQAIQAAEKQTSGEIRLYVEGKNKLDSPVQRAAVIFEKLQMHKTKERNGVLIYLASRSRQLAIFADEGVYQRLGKDYWDKQANEAVALARNNDVKKALVKLIEDIGGILAHEFPYSSETDHNELSDDIVFGKK